MIMSHRVWAAPPGTLCPKPSTTPESATRLACQSGYELRVIGIPKTIDNDLAVTDHCPGFGSAAKFAAASALEAAQDASALPIHVVVMELMGRNAGWITAASALYADLMPCGPAGRSCGRCPWSRCRRCRRSSGY